jgi:hypothetical protein
MKSFAQKTLAFAFVLGLAPLALATPSDDAHRPRPPRHDMWECVSQNLRRQRFHAVDYNRFWAQEKAQNKCLRYSQACRPLGCRRL